MVCKYGSTTKGGCGRLGSKEFLPFLYVPNLSATFHVLKNQGGVDLSSPGDSGGPVYVGNSAWGTISGEAFSFDYLCTCDLIYVAINYVESGLGVVVLRQ